MSAPAISNGDSGSSARGKINTILAGEFARSAVYAGSELISNTDFASNADGWTLGDATTWSAGQLVTAYNGSNNPVISVDVELVTGQTYLLELHQTLVNDLTGIYTNNQSPGFYFFSALETLKIAFVSNFTGTDTLVLDSDLYNVGTRTLTFASLRAIASVETPVDITGYDGKPFFNLNNSYNIKIGPGALDSLANGFGNVAIGEATLQNNLGGSNIAIGPSALKTMTGGSNNVAVGAVAMFMATTALNNVAIGTSSLLKLTTGNFNVAVGVQAGQNITTGINNIILGSNLALPAGNISHYLNIGDVITGDMAAGPLAISRPLAIASAAPASASAAGVAGTVTWDSDFLYVCVATDTWKRAALATWP